MSHLPTTHPSQSKPRALITTPDSGMRARFFSDDLNHRLNEACDAVWNPYGRYLREDELKSMLPGIDVLFTSWHCPPLTESVLASATELKLVLHLGGSIADVATPKLYAREIPICSGNAIMAKYVAESVLAYMLATVHGPSEYDKAMKSGQIWPSDSFPARSLRDMSVGLIGCGAIARELLALLAPLQPRILAYDPYYKPDQHVLPLPVESTTLDTLLSDADLVSIHAALTQETKGLLGRQELSLIKPGAVLINTARAAIIDRNALLHRLARNDIKAVLDVYHQEPVPVDDPLRSFPYVTLLPHVAGNASFMKITAALIDELNAFLQGRPLRYAIHQDQCASMTRQRTATP